jgi:hypothetical protein
MVDKGTLRLYWFAAYYYAESVLLCSTHLQMKVIAN